MGIRVYRPTSPGRRKSSVSDFAEITCTTPERSLLRPLVRRAGRNSYGRITSRRRGGGHKRRYRIIDWKRNKDGVPAKVATIEYDPNRSARIALLHYADGEKRYILAPRGIQVGQAIMSGPEAEPRVGNAKMLKDIPLGLTVHNVELVPGKGGQLARSAGTSAQLAARENGMATLNLPSGEMRMVPETCRATIGQVGNSDHALVRIGKAGRNRHRGRRPKVRGAAMNPYCHPLGGGEGRAGAGRRKGPCSPWGKPSKGGKTRKKKNASSRLIIRGRKKKKR